MAKDRNKTPAASSGAEAKPSRRRSASDAFEARDVLADLQKTLGYRFAQPELLKLALTHRSHPYEARTPEPEHAGSHLQTSGPSRARDNRNTPGTDNEQLEFLGDAVLGLAVTELLFRQFPKQSEGELTRMRASLVSRQRMASLGTELGLGEHLRVGRSAEQNGARQKPALLANAAEAVVAAVYLDATGRGADALAEVRRLVDQRLLRPDLPSLRAALRKEDGRGALRDAKTILQERVQAEAAGRLRYADIGQTGPAHQRRFTVEARLEEANGSTVVLASAEGSSKKEAQQRAAERALQSWDKRFPASQASSIKNQAESSTEHPPRPSANAEQLDRSEDAA
jgi:ribonuclease-3